MLKQKIINYLENHSYNINISCRGIYINNFKMIDTITNNRIIIFLEEFKLIIMGNDFSVLKLLDNEILFNGVIESINIEYL